MLALRRWFNAIFAFLMRRTRTMPRALSKPVNSDIIGETEDVDDTFPEIVQLEIRDSIDLHTIPPRDIPAVVAEYLREARGRGFVTVRIIHGKGKGTQRAVVRRILAGTDFVIDYRDAPAYSGGWGATVAHLRMFENIDEDARSRDLR
jgi:dsDNA-specific endonuclease/ATPase MutS2